MLPAWCCADDDESSGSDDDVGGQQGAWLANWVQDEFGADLQEQASAGLCSWRRGFKLFVSWHPDGVVGREPAAGSGGARGALSSCAQGWKPGPWDSQQSAFVPVCPPSLLQEQDMVVAGEGLPFDQMDEGESSEEEGLEDLEAGEHFDLAAAGGGAPAAAGAAPAGPPAGDGAAPAGAAPLLVQASPAETLLRALSRQNTRARNRLRCPLSRPVGANLVLVKLINQVGRQAGRQGCARCEEAGRRADTAIAVLPRDPAHGRDAPNLPGVVCRRT